MVRMQADGQLLMAQERSSSTHSNFSSSLASLVLLVLSWPLDETEGFVLEFVQIWIWDAKEKGEELEKKREKVEWGRRRKWVFWVCANVCRFFPIYFVKCVN